MAKNKGPVEQVCPVCAQRVLGAWPSHGGRVLKAWHAACSPYMGKELRKK